MNGFTFICKGWLSPSSSTPSQSFDVILGFPIRRNSVQLFGFESLAVKEISARIIYPRQDGFFFCSFGPFGIPIKGLKFALLFLQHHRDAPSGVDKSTELYRNGSGSW